MNIFILNKDPVKSAEMLCDKHIVKMSLEYAQILSTVCHLKEIKSDLIYKSTHKNHPCVKWTNESFINYRWLLRHAIATHLQYKNRYKRIHKSLSIINECEINLELCNNWTYYEATPFVNCTPYKEEENVVMAYQKYYIIDKSKFAKWKIGNIPNFMVKG